MKKLVGALILIGMLLVYPLMFTEETTVEGLGWLSIDTVYASPGIVFVRSAEATGTNVALTFSNFEVSAGTDRVLVVGGAYKSNNPAVPVSIVFNTSEGFSVERAAADSSDAQCFLYYLTNPTVTTADVVITMPGAVRMVAYVAYFTGVHQSDPFTAATDEAYGSDAAPTVTISSAADEMVVDIMAQVSAGPDTIDSNSGTLICSGAATGGGSDARGGGQYEVGTASRQMLYGMSGTDDWNIIAGALQEPAACTPDISNSPSDKDFGTVSASSDYWSNGGTPTFPLDDGECYFTVTNNSGGVVDITVKGTNWTGGVGWTLTSGVPGEDTVRVKAGKSGDALEGDMVILTTSEQSFVTGLADSGTKKWEIKLETGTYTDGAEKSSTITLTATCQ